MTNKTNSISSPSQLVLLVGTPKGPLRIGTELSPNTWNLERLLIAGYEILRAWMNPNPRMPQHAYAAINHPLWKHDN